MLLHKAACISGVKTLICVTGPEQDLTWTLLCRWRQVLEDRDFVRSTVRTCIMRKKVSFAFFKQWYWDCFDEDVQVRPVSCSGSQSQVPLVRTFLQATSNVLAQWQSAAF